MRRHTLLLADQEILIIERALKCYATVMAIQTSATMNDEADLNARVCGVVQGHRNCVCPVPIN